jgi:hypothetical protein
MVEKDAAREQQDEADIRQQVSLLIAVRIPAAVGAKRSDQWNLITAAEQVMAFVPCIAVDGTTSGMGRCSQLDCAERTMASPERQVYLPTLAERGGATKHRAKGQGMFWTQRRILIGIAVILVLTAIGVACSVLISPT